MSSVMSASVEEDICLDVDDTTTYGTLRVPPHREGQRLAAALLLPGSGPVDAKVARIDDAISPVDAAAKVAAGIAS